jgi:putative methionine-R-sulfoxide reductase with GAF domain
MPSTTTSSNLPFYLLQPNDCIGDSIGYLNANTQNTLTLVNTASASIINKFTVTGSVVQTVFNSTAATTTYSPAKNTLSVITDLNTSITTKYTNSKILVRYVLTNSTYVGFYGVARGGTGIGGFTANDAGGNYLNIPNVLTMAWDGINSYGSLRNTAVEYIDSPAQPAGTVLQYAPTAGSTWSNGTTSTAYKVYLNRRGSDASMFGTSSMTLTEIAP